MTSLPKLISCCKGCVIPTSSCRRARDAFSKLAHPFGETLAQRGTCWHLSTRGSRLGDRFHVISVFVVIVRQQSGLSWIWVVAVDPLAVVLRLSFGHDRAHNGAHEGPGEAPLRPRHLRRRLNDPAKCHRSLVDCLLGFKWFQLRIKFKTIDDSKIFFIKNMPQLPDFRSTLARRR